MARLREGASKWDEHIFDWKREYAFPIEITLWPTVERVLFGSLAYPPTSPRPAHQQEQIRTVVERLLASDVPAASFREWVEIVGCDGTDA